MSVTVRSILANYIDMVNPHMTYEDKTQLTSMIRQDIKENIGNGISEAYYNKLWKSDKFKVTSICGHIVHAFNKIGAYSDENVFGQKYAKAVKKYEKQYVAKYKSKSKTKCK